MQSVLMFMFIFLDANTPCGAFAWPSKEGEGQPTPHIVDYPFISLNVNSTYATSSEALMSRKVKTAIVLQTPLALVMLTALMMRAVPSTY